MQLARNHGMSQNSMPCQAKLKMKNVVAVRSVILRSLAQSRQRPLSLFAQKQQLQPRLIRRTLATGAGASTPETSNAAVGARVTNKFLTILISVSSRLHLPQLTKLLGIQNGERSYKFSVASLSSPSLQAQGHSTISRRKIVIQAFSCLSTQTRKPL